MNKTLVAAAALFCAAGALISQSALADNPSGPYVGAGWGQFNLNIDNLSEAGSAVSNIVKSKDDAWKIFAGYRVNPYLSFEGAYIDFGKPGDRFSATGSDGNYRVHLTGFAPYVIGTVPLGPVELFGKAGYYFYDSDVRVNFDGPDQGVESKHSSSDFIYGGGVGITFFEHLNIRAEYEKVDVDNARNSNATWVSAAWRF